MVVQGKGLVASLQGKDSLQGRCEFYSPRFPGCPSFLTPDPYGAPYAPDCPPCCPPPFSATAGLVGPRGQPFSTRKLPDGIDGSMAQELLERASRTPRNNRCLAVLANLLCFFFRECHSFPKLPDKLLFKDVRCNLDVCPELMSRNQRIVQRGWLILIPHEDKVDVTSPINMFGGGGEF